MVALFGIQCRHKCLTCPMAIVQRVKLGYTIIAIAYSTCRWMIRKSQVIINPHYPGFTLTGISFVRIGDVVEESLLTRALNTAALVTENSLRGTPLRGVKL